MIFSRRLPAFLIILLAHALQIGIAFSPSATKNHHHHHQSRLNAVTPVGPFCPFRSSSSVAMEPKMEAIHAAGPEFASEMTKIQLDMSVGEMPDPDRLHRVADGLENAVDQWENLVTRLRLSSDFQTREYAKLTQAHLQTHDLTVDEIASMMRWQAGCMRAMADNTPPPMPPMDLQKMMQQNEREKPSITAMTAAEAITKAPFSKDSVAFASPNVKQEYEALCRDHMNLIEFGAKYDTFDPFGKLYYLNEIEKIEDRWDVFFTRFKLMGQLDPEYLEQCNQFLASMGMNEEEYRQLLKKCHDIMREEAEAERNLFAA